MSLTERYAFRRQLVDAVVRDLVGPDSEEEVLDDDPVSRYASGVLYPQQSGTIDWSEDIDIADDDDEGRAADPPVALANVLYPSSMGMTFAVDSRATDTLTIQIRAARYMPFEPESEPSETLSADQDQIHRVQPRRAGPRQRWRREPIAPDPIPLDISRPCAGESRTVAPGLDLFYRVRKPDASRAIAVTTILLNTYAAPSQGTRSPYSFFQPEIEVTAPLVPDGPFIERPKSRLVADDEDLRAYRLLYRHAREFAIGHGCSVRWELTHTDSARARVIATTFTPEYEVSMAESNPKIESSCLSMRQLIEAPRDEVLPGLRGLCDGYEGWIRSRAEELAELDEKLRDTARAHLRACEEACDRMRHGVRLLEKDEVALRAFRLANEAMLRQRARTTWLREGRQDPSPDESRDHRWRPFQLAFILLCLEGLTDAHSPDRALADLLWFPTGGGKTEAYLGLIAYTVFLRRLRYPADGGGVVALMRYTLRLLTIQQFERATLLICCCEAMRRERTELGQEPISIGLWVGQGATPNSLDNTRVALNKLRAGGDPEEGSPVQLQSCPWCGHPLDHRNYWIASERRRLVISCRQQDCLFSQQLPVFVVDEDLYNQRPTLIIATVDKFAGLPWKEETGNLFNLALGARKAQRPPELIIQDELHLISGPLGTLVGLYETAVDALCARDGLRPKVIASTATIRQARQQGRALFNHDVRQFPPPGLDARDSYFAVDAPQEERGTRMYVGVMAPGTSHTTLLVRTYAALLQNAQGLPAPDEVKDPYWTLVGYFISLRALGGARMQVQDDVQDRMELLARKNGTTKRPIDERIELTSREPSKNIPDHLKRMALSYPSPRALDVILATNMISVGVDIDRLGLMAVMSQPHSTSEYIQSTSRVGRQYPGLVFALFNAARSRDRSHYESFVAYHSTLYRQVESTSVTPFSARARDRGLHAVVVALTRQLLRDMRANNTAGSLPAQRARLAAIRDLIVDRVRQVAPDEVAATERHIDALLDSWEFRATGGQGLVYRADRDPSKALLVDAASDEAGSEDAFPTLWSLRDVDRDSNLYLANLRLTR